MKCSLRQEFVIGGYTEPQGARTGFGALLLGVHERGELRYCGKVGTGFNDATLATLAKRLSKLATDKPPFANPPTGAEGRHAHWVKPELVGEVSFTEWTRDGTLRHPSFQGVREDKPARDIVREMPAGNAADSGAQGDTEPKPAATRPARKPSARRRASGDNPDAADEIEGVAISNAGKLLYPEAGITKLDVARYYAAVGERLVAQLRDRPLTLVRCPNGWDKPCFYQKHANQSVSQYIDRIDIRDSGGVKPYMMANSVSAVVALLQMGVLELHPWGSRAPKLGYPDRLIFDFDPDEALGFDKLVDAVTVLRKLLDTLELEAFLKTTGGKGLHVVVPLEPARSWDEAKEFCRGVAELLVRTFPDRFIAKATKSRRNGLIFVDYLRNAEGATAVAAYSVRAKANAPVAMPIDWAELDKDVRFDYFNVRNVPAQLRKRRRDPWDRLPRVRQALTDAMLAQVRSGATRR